jgi:hypothetical protein
VKVKVKLSLCLTKYSAMKAYWEVEVHLHALFDLGTRWRWLVNFTPLPLYPHWNPLVTAWWTPEPFCSMSNNLFNFSVPTQRHRV